MILLLLQLCINGDCTGSICLEWNLTECFLTSNIIPNIDKRKLCELACQNGTDTSTCRSTSEFAQSVGLPKGGISLRPGSPCDNFQVISPSSSRSFYALSVRRSLSYSDNVFVRRLYTIDKIWGSETDPGNNLFEKWSRHM